MANTGYGRACANCAASKAKCTLRGEGLACERCLRLKKECRPSPNRRRKPGPKPGRASQRVSQTDRLEARLDGLVALIGSLPGMPAVDSGSDATAGTNGAAVPSMTSTSSSSMGASAQLSPASSSAATATVQPPLLHPSTAAANTTNHDTSTTTPLSLEAPSCLDPDPLGIDPAFAPTDAEAQEALDRFRNSHVHAFPFVYLPPAVDAAQLRRYRPLLWLAVQLASARSAPAQQHYGQRLQSLLSEQVVAQPGRTLDHLLGTLGVLIWSMYQCGRLPFVFMFGHIMAALVQDLGMDRPADRTSQAAAAAAAAFSTTATSASASGSSAPYGQRNDMPADGQTSDEHPFACVRNAHSMRPVSQNDTLGPWSEARRAVLGAYYVSCLICIFHRKPPVLTWNSHFDDCLRTLEACPETPLDRVLAYQVRLHRIASEVSSVGNSILVPTPSSVPTPFPTSTFHPHSASISAPPNESLRMARDFQIQTLLARLEDVIKLSPANDLPHDLSVVCRLSTMSVEACLCSMVVQPLAWSPPSSSTYSSSSYSSAIPTPQQVPMASVTWRIETLTRAMHLCKEWFALVFSIPADRLYHLFGFPLVVQSSLFAVLMYRLATFRDPTMAWNRQQAREYLDIPNVLDTLADRFQEAPASVNYFAGDLIDRDFFSRGSNAIRLIKSTWLSRWEKEDREERESQNAQQQQRQQQQQQQQQQHQQQQHQQQQQQHQQQQEQQGQHQQQEQQAQQPDQPLLDPAVDLNLYSSSFGLDSQEGWGVWMADVLATAWTDSL